MESKPNGKGLALAVTTRGTTYWATSLVILPWQGGLEPGETVFIREEGLGQGERPHLFSWLILPLPELAVFSTALFAVLHHIVLWLALLAGSLRQGFASTFPEDSYEVKR